MDDRLKALKSLQQLICVAAAAVVAFAFTSDHSKEYKAALDELGYYRKIDLNDYTLYLQQQLKSATDDDRRLLLKAARQAHFKFSESVSVTEPIIADFPLFGVEHLRDFDTFVSSRHDAGVYVVEDEREVLDKITLQLKEKTQPSVQSAPPQQPTGPPISFTVTSISASAGKSVVLRNGVALSDPEVLHNGANVENLQFLLMNGLPLPPALNFSVSCRFISLPSTHPAYDWLKADENGKHLIDPSTGIVFPKLRPYWERIADMRADTAALFLQERIEAATKGSLSLFGVSVDRDLILLAGPAALAGLMLFFLLHLNQVNRPASWGESELESATDYPWIMCFQDVWSTTTAYGCLVILPVVACTFLLLNHGERGEGTTWGGIALSSFVVLIAAVTAVAIHRFRRHLGDGNIVVASPPSSNVTE